MLCPQQHCGATAGSQDLFGCPESVGNFRRLDLQQSIGRQADVIEAGSIRDMRRPDQCDRPCVQQIQCGAEKSHFADTRLLDQQIDQLT